MYVLDNGGTLINTIAKELEGIVDLAAHQLDQKNFITSCRKKLVSDGILVLPRFLTQQAVNILTAEAEMGHSGAFYTNTSHNVYLTKPNPSLSSDHIFNRQVVSSQGCIATDQIPSGSKLKSIYNSKLFRQFAAKVLEQDKLYQYADPLSSINVTYAQEGQKLGWHFDNSSFSITLLLQAPEAGGIFEYVKDIRNAESDDMNFTGVTDVVEGKIEPMRVTLEPGTLTLFRGKNSIHRVTGTIGKKKRMLVVFAYNQLPGIALSEAARMTFFGRLQ